MLLILTVLIQATMVAGTGIELTTNNSPSLMAALVEDLAKPEVPGVQITHTNQVHVSGGGQQ
eukprot:12406984-Karenia_brevis.AAC.1